MSSSCADRRLGKPGASIPDYTGRKSLPASDTPWEPQRYRPIGSGEQLTLRTGDVLYIPRGGMHSAASLAEESMHLTIGLTPMTYTDLLAAALARVVTDDEMFRRRVPLCSQGAHDPTALAAEVGILIDRLRAQIDLSAVNRLGIATPEILRWAGRDNRPRVAPTGNAPATGEGHILKQFRIGQDQLSWSAHAGHLVGAPANNWHVVLCDRVEGPRTRAMTSVDN